MWNAPANTIPREAIFREHLRVLENAIRDWEEFPVDTQPVMEALAYFRSRAHRQGGINLITRGIEHNRHDWMQEGLELVKKHFGVV